MTLVIIFVVLVSLTFLAYASKRRFGALGLALCAGLVLSQQIARDASNFLQATDVPVEPLAYQSAASILLILLPSLVLLIAGPQYTVKRSRVIGSLAYGLLATMLLLGPLTVDLPTLDVSVKPVLDMIAANKPALLTVAIVAAVVDMFSANKPQKLPKKH